MKKSKLIELIKIYRPEHCLDGYSKSELEKFLEVVIKNDTKPSFMSDEDHVVASLIDLISENRDNFNNWYKKKYPNRKLGLFKDEN